MKDNLKVHINKYKRSPFSLIMFLFTMISAVFTFGMLLYIIVYILSKGIPYLTPSLFAFEYNSENVSMMPALINTVFTVAASLIISIPFGVFSAIYLVEYAKSSSPIVSVIRLTTETLSGIPSVVYGLFGMLFFVFTLEWNYSFLAGVLTLSIMVLPLIMRTTEEALISVPKEYREASFGLGAGRLRTVFKIILPAAAPGILSGVILATGRIVGETAALIYTMGTVAKIPDSLFSSSRTLSVHLYALSGEGLYIDQAYATAVILILVVLLINALSSFIAGKFKY